MNPRGGTEILKEQLIAQLEPGSIDGINLIGSICHPSLVEKNKTNVLWQHLSYDQPNVQYMRDRKFVDSIDYFIYVVSIVYCLWRIFKSYKKLFGESVIGPTPGLDTLVVIIFAPVLAIVDVSMTWIRLYREAEEKRRKREKLF